MPFLGPLWAKPAWIPTIFFSILMCFDQVYIISEEEKIHRVHSCSNQSMVHIYHEKGHFYTILALTLVVEIFAEVHSLKSGHASFRTLRRFRHSRANTVNIFLLRIWCKPGQNTSESKRNGGIQVGLAHRGPRKMPFFIEKHLFSR